MYGCIKVFTVVLHLSFDEVQSFTTPVTLMVNIFSWFLCLFVILLYAKGISKVSLGKEIFHSKKPVRHYLSGLGIGVLLMTSVFSINLFFHFIEVSVRDSIDWTLIFLLFIFYLIQGFTEEIMLRGYFFGELRKRFRLPVATIISSLLFALLHSLNDGVTVLSIANLFLFGVAFAWTYQYTNSIYLVGAMHSMWNFFMGPVFGVQVSGEASASIFQTTSLAQDTVYNGGSFGFEGGLVVTGIFLVALFLLRKRKVSDKSERNLLTYSK
ncbi:MAG: lysostaphin resistance A-like protein [Enterococcus sp.]